jgi:hypothetical protein
MAVRHESGECPAGVVVVCVVMHVGFRGGVFGRDEFCGAPLWGCVVRVSGLDYEFLVEC